MNTKPSLIQFSLVNDKTKDSIIYEWKVRKSRHDEYEPGIGDYYEIARIALGAPHDERDPFTGKAFLYEKQEDKIVVASPLTTEEELLEKVSERLSWEELLTWEIHGTSTKDKK